MKEYVKVRCNLLFFLFLIDLTHNSLCKIIAPTIRLCMPLYLSHIHMLMYAYVEVKQMTVMVQRMSGKIQMILLIGKDSIVLFERGLGLAVSVYCKL